MEIDLGSHLGKCIQVKVLEDVEDLSNFGLSVVNNGNGGGATEEEFSFPAQSAMEGDVLWVGRDETALSQYFGTCFDQDIFIQANEAMNHNGNIFVNCSTHANSAWLCVCFFSGGGLRERKSPRFTILFLYFLFSFFEVMMQLYCLKMEKLLIHMEILKLMERELHGNIWILGHIKQMVSSTDNLNL